MRLGPRYRPTRRMRSSSPRDNQTNRLSTQVGRFVRPNPEQLWHESVLTPAHNLSMGWPSKREFDQELCARVKHFRETLGWTQQQMADALQVTRSAYEKYEIRTPLPTHLIPRYSQFVGCQIAYLMTGKRESLPGNLPPPIFAPRPANGGKVRKKPRSDKSSKHRLT